MTKKSVPSGDGEGWRGAPGCGREEGEVPLLVLVYDRSVLAERFRFAKSFSSRPIQGEANKKPRGECLGASYLCS